MRTLYFILALTMTRGAVPARAQAAAPDSLLAIDSAWARSYAQRDTALAGRLFAHDLIVTSGSGSVKDRAGELRDVGADDSYLVHYFRTRDVTVRTRTGMGVVHGIAEWAFTHAGTRREARRVYTAVYARGGPLGWEMIALHLSALPNPTP